MPIPIPLITAGLGFLQSGFQLFGGKKDKQDGEEALRNYKRQDLDQSNAYKGVPISTVGSDLIKEQSAQTAATSIDAARSGGSRTLLSALPGIQSGINSQNQEARAYLDNQVIKRNYAVADDEVRLRSMKERREEADLSGIGRQIEVGRQNQFSALSGIRNSLTSFGVNGGFGGPSRNIPESIGNFSSQGVAMSSSIPTSNVSAYNGVVQQQQQESNFNRISPNNAGF